MSDSDLAFFTLLARHSSFAGTARELGISASAVSRRLARLEDRLGVRLLNRTTRKVSLTGEGEEYFTNATRILGQIIELEQRLNTAREIPKGLLRINATFGFSRSYLAPAISEFKHKYPEVEVQLILSDAPLNLVEEGLDLGIRFGMQPDSRLVMRRLLKNRRLLCAAPSYLEKHGIPKSLKELQRHNCVVLRQDLDAYDVWRFDDVGGELASAKVSGDLSTNDGEIALAWVLEGHGIMLRSEWDIACHVREGRLCVVLADYVQSANISAVYPARHNLSAKVRVFIESLCERLSAITSTHPLGLTRAELRGLDGGLV